MGMQETERQQAGMQKTGMQHAGMQDVVDEQRPAKDLSAGCPMAGFLEMLTRPWTLHILWLLSTNGPMRFGALRRGAEGISARLLTVRLRTLETEGFVRRTTQRTGQRGKVTEVTYSPTERLAEMNEVMAKLQGLSDRWQGRPGGSGR